MPHWAMREIRKAAVRASALAAVAAMTWIGLGQPAAALIVDDSTSTVTVESADDIGLMFDVVYACDGIVSGEGTQSDCEAATSTDLNGDGVDDLGGTWWTITDFSDTSVTFEITVMNTADDASLSDFGVKIIDPEASGASLSDDGTLDWLIYTDTNFAGFMTVDICLAATVQGGCTGGPQKLALKEGETDTLTLTLYGDWTDGVDLIIFPSKWGSIGTLGLSQEIEGTLTSSGDDPFPVPEPSSLLLFGTGLAGVTFLIRRRQRRPKSTMQD